LRQGNTGAPLPMTDDEPHSLFLLVDFLGLSDAELRIVRKERDFLMRQCQ
jgi:hypothetical protein